ncbi:LamG domain-containing protein [Acinetobacter sp. SA01]|uniref:LamG domain-containing protein n=1 Tax=Acinetobacter sp. SA01 TaxID=1862567 RepID=UPI00140E629E|nr:LamG domain-containing protein [Acinetobacter sp. SA01]
MIKTPLSTVIGGAGIWTPGCTVIGGQQNLTQLIKSLFSDGTQGLYLNPQDAVSVSDLSSIKDLSGRNNHATQANATSRASLITDPSGYKSLKFDGIDDGYVTPSINFTNTDKVTVIAAVRKLSDAAIGMLCEFSADLGSNYGSFYLGAPATSGNGSITFNSKGTFFAAATDTSVFAPVSVVVTGYANIAAPLSVIRRNGVFKNSNSLSQGTGNYGNYPLYIGRRGGTSLPFNGQIYALLVIGKLLDAATTAKIEKEFAKYIGVTL